MCVINRDPVTGKQQGVMSGDPVTGKQQGVMSGACFKNNKNDCRNALFTFPDFRLHIDFTCRLTTN